MVNFFGADGPAPISEERLSETELLYLARAFSCAWHMDAAVIYAGSGSVVKISADPDTTQDAIISVANGVAPGVFVGKVMSSCQPIAPAKALHDGSNPIPTIREGFILECMQDLIDNFVVTHNIPDGELVEIDHERGVRIDPFVAWYSDGLIASFFNLNSMPAILGTLRFLADTYSFSESGANKGECYRMMGQDLYCAAVGLESVCGTPYPEEWVPLDEDDTNYGLAAVIAEVFHGSVFDLVRRRIISSPQGIGLQPARAGALIVKVDQPSLRALIETIS